MTSPLTPSDDLAHLLPHRPPMILLDRLLSYDRAAQTATTEVTIGPNQLFFDGAGVPASVAIEYMAQTAAALTGLADRANGTLPRPGFLLGTRRLTLAVPRFEKGETYRITATCAFSDAEAAAFTCSIVDSSERIVATATLNAYRPTNLATFLKEQEQHT